MEEARTLERAQRALKRDAITKGWCLGKMKGVRKREQVVKEAMSR
jgi:hypothetical protein